MELPMTTPQAKSFTITDSAKQYILEYMEEKNVHISLAVQGGGCSGFMTTFREDVNPSALDVVFFTSENKKYAFFVDPKSNTFLQNMQLDFINEPFNKQLILVSTSPYKNTCGCGKSFS